MTSRAKGLGTASFVALSAALAGTAGCSSTEALPPIETADHVDLERFMGDWYVIANIPTFIEKKAYNAVESYALNDDGTVDTTFSFNKGGFDGKRKAYNPRGFVRDDPSNAIWGMRFVWPFKAEYRVIYLDDAYEQTIIGRSKRDYVWIMARTPTIPNEDYFQHIKFLREQGYDTSKIQRVPQRWDATDES
ncbi:MAG: lipocalin family protein [Pseudomonadota bacterium]